MSEDFGLLYRSTFTGSMVGTSPVVFAVWGYVVANGYGGHVDLNPRLLAAIFGTTVADVEAAIRLHCAPDPDSRSDSDEGRRLRHLGGVSYEIVNHELYKNARALEEKRAYNRAKKRASRERASSTIEIPIVDLSKKSLTSGDPLLSLSSDLISSDPEGVQGEPTVIESRMAPSDYAATEAQVERCRELGHDVEALLREWKRHEYPRPYTNWELRFDKWIETQRQPARRLSARPPRLLEPNEAQRRHASKHGVDLGAIVASLEDRGVVEALGLGRARELISSELAKAVQARARPAPHAA